MKKHDYEKEILDVLASNQNCVIGFNNLRKLGNGKGFHPNILKDYLLKLQSEGMITVEKIGNRSKICRVEQNFEEKVSAFLKDTKKIETKTFKKTNDEERFVTILEYLTVLIEKYRELILGEIFSKSVIPNKKKVQDIEKVKSRLLSLMIQKFDTLKEEDKEKMLDRLLNRY